MEKILLIGAGALAHDIIEIYGAHRFVAAYVDAPYAKSNVIAGIPLLTNWPQATALSTHYTLAIADITLRARFIALAADQGLKPAPPLISSLAKISNTALLADGCVTGHFSVIGPSVRLESDCLIMHHVTVGHDSTIGSNVIMCQSACLAGYVHLGSNCFVGSNATLAPQIHIGNNSFIAAGAVCLKDAADHSQLIGNPAKRIPYTNRTS